MNSKSISSTQYYFKEYQSRYDIYEKKKRLIEKIKDAYLTEIFLSDLDFSLKGKVISEFQDLMDLDYLTTKTLRQLKLTMLDHFTQVLKANHLPYTVQKVKLSGPI